MQSLGILTINRIREDEYFTGIAKFVTQSGWQCIIIHPEHIRTESPTVTGFTYSAEHDTWIEDTVSLPSILYDRCFYRNEEERKQYSPIISWLKSREDLTFLGYGLPNKQIIYDTLKMSPHLFPYLPETRMAREPKDVFNKLSAEEKIILKPVFGSQGRGIYLVEKAKDRFIIRTVKNGQLVKKELTKDIAKRFFLKLFESFHYCQQPYLTLTTKDDRPFDIRILLQKDNKGRWVERGRGLRVGKKNSIISNLAGGGEPFRYDEWIKTLPNEKRQFIREEIDELVKTIPEILEKIYHPLFEIGMDIGIDRNGALWLLEVNSKPGHTVLTALQPEIQDTLHKAPLHYAMFLKDSPVKGEHKDETIISN